MVSFILVTTEVTVAYFKTIADERDLRFGGRETPLTASSLQPTHPGFVKTIQTPCNVLDHGLNCCRNSARQDILCMRHLGSRSFSYSTCTHEHIRSRHAKHLAACPETSLQHVSSLRPSSGLDKITHESRVDRALVLRLSTLPTQSAPDSRRTHHVVPH